MTFSAFQQMSHAFGVDPGSAKRSAAELRAAAADPRAMHALLAPLFREVVERYVTAGTVASGEKGLNALEDGMAALMAEMLAVSRGAPGVFRRICDALELTQDDAPWLLHVTLATVLQGVIANYTKYLAKGSEPGRSRVDEDDVPIVETALGLKLRAAGLGGKNLEEPLLPEPEEADVAEETADVWQSHLSACHDIWENLALGLTLRHGEPATSRWLEQALRQSSPQRRGTRVAGLALAGKGRKALEAELSDSVHAGGTAHDGDDPQVARSGLEFSAIVLDMVLEVLGRTAKPALTLTPNNKRDVRRLRPHESLIRALATVHGGARLCDPSGPILNKPRAWSMTGPDPGRTERGGLHHRKMSFYKFQDKNKPIRDFLAAVNNDTAAFTTVFAAVNALQETSWRINRRVWEVQQAILKGCDDPELVDSRLGAAFKDVVVAPSFASKWKGWLKEKFFARHRPSQGGSLGHRKHASPGWRLISPHGALEVMRLAREDHFHFAYNIDSRGRIYPLGSYLHPQGEDTFRALLEFSVEQPITEQGVRWLALHGSQCASTQRIASELGVKSAILSAEQRLTWIEKVTPMILESAAEAMECTWWRDVGGKSAFQFLAFCYAWSDLKKGDHRVKSRLPIHVDGTCNGLQHIAALTRDRPLGGAVNLVPGEPADIYMSVTRAVLERASVPDRRVVVKPDEGKPFELSLHEFEPRLRALLGAHPNLVDRDAAKKVVMVIPYGATVRSYAKELASHLKNSAADPRLLEELSAMGKIAADRIRQAFEDDKAASSRLRGKLEKKREREGKGLELYYGRLLLSTLLAREFDAALRERYPVIGSFKAWLQETCKSVTDRHLPLMWVSPSGLPVLQNGFKASTDRIDVRGIGRIRLSHYTLTDAVDSQRQSRGILPNFIHSLDGAHLVGTIRRAQALGVRSFSMIHDSFGTHAADMPKLARALRAAFVELYADDRLEELRAFLVAYVDGQALAILGEDNRSRTKASLIAVANGLRGERSSRKRRGQAAGLPSFGGTGDLDIASVANSEYFFC